MSPTRPPRKPAAARRDPAHPSADAWFARVSGRLSARAAATLDRHRAGCPTCKASAGIAERVSRAVDFSELPPVPATLRRAAERLFGPTVSVVPAAISAPNAGVTIFPLGRLRLIAPSPAYTSGFAPSAGGVRRAGESLRRCALEGGPWRLELEWTPHDRAWHLRGRVVGVDADDATAARFTLEGAGISVRRVRPGPRGFFGPILLTSPEVRITLVRGEKSFRSPWLPRAPRRR